MQVRMDWQSLQAFTAEIFTRAGLKPEDAQTEAEVLVWANLRGIDSHGVLRVPQYLRNIDRGGMNPRAEIRVEKETAATALVEGDHAFGPVVTKFAMNIAISKAAEVGIGWVVIRNTTHQGAMGYYTMMAADRDMAGLAFVCNPPNMAPYGAKAAGLHNSPISIAVPGNKHRPLVLDMATSVAAMGKISLAIDKGTPIPQGWALDKDGQPTTDPRLAAILLPFGGYKASHLALMFECLSSLMVCNPLLEPTLLHQEPVRPGTQNSVVAAINIGLFTDIETYKQHIDALVEGLKGLPKADGFDEILVPGEFEDRVCEERLALGIPLPPGTVDNLREAAARFGIPLPPALHEEAA
ncbi:MAG: Ldh family oxidoreductase [Chloroflexi bacterium]|jgi:LDH2 family malate/lactate/ureidoglycolate dehydrogenase|nr:Ldh family oxidoreductase [Chloroflexota bacterium]